MGRQAVLDHQTAWPREDLHAAELIENAFKNTWSSPTRIEELTVRSTQPSDRPSALIRSIRLSEFEALLVYGRIHTTTGPSDTAAWMDRCLDHGFSHPPRRSSFPETFGRLWAQIHARLKSTGQCCDLFCGVVDASRRRLDYLSAGLSGQVRLLRDGQWVCLEQTSHTLGGQVTGQWRCQSVTLGTVPRCILMVTSRTVETERFGETWLTPVDEAFEGWFSRVSQLAGSSELTAYACEFGCGRGRASEPTASQTGEGTMVATGWPSPLYFG